MKIKMIELIKEYIKQNFDIKNKPNTTYRNYMFVVCFLTFASIFINCPNRAIIFYSFIGIGIIYMIIYFTFYDVEPEEKQNITYEIQKPSLLDRLENKLTEFAGYFSIVITFIITIWMIIMLYSSVGLGMFILIMLVGGGVVLPIIYGISDIISKLLTPILLFIIFVLVLYYIMH